MLLDKTMRNNTQLIGARTSDGYPIDVYDDSYGPVFVFGHEHGPTLVIRSRSWHSAWEIAIDEMRPISEEEVPEAYGFDGWDSAGERTETEYSPDTARARFERWIEDAESGEKDYPELLEGYEYQSNSTGTGIVNVGHYAWLEEYDHDRHDVRLIIRHEDHEPLSAEVWVSPYDCIGWVLYDDRDRRYGALRYAPLDSIVASGSAEYGNVGDVMTEIDRIAGSDGCRVTFVREGSQCE